VVPRTRKYWHLLLLSIGCSVPHDCRAQQKPSDKSGSSRSTHWAAKGLEIVRLVRANFYDRQVAEAWAAKNAAYAAAADSELKFSALTKRVLADLRASHTGFYTGREPEYYSLLGIYGRSLHAGDGEFVSGGMDVTPDHFVRVVFAGSPAARAGIRRGDKIVTASGREFDPIASFQGRAGVPVDLAVQREPGKPPIRILLSPRRIKPRLEWMEAQKKGARLITRYGKTIAYVPMFSCVGDEYADALKEQLNTELRDAEALILDFRNGWGGCSPDFVNLFNQTPAILTFTAPDGKMRRMDMQWRKPLYLLINGGSRSGKEAVAYSIKKHRLGTLVGTTTARAVVAGRCFLLSDRSLLLLAVEDVRVDGERLEGRGVEPDVLVPDSLQYAGGADPQLEKAIDLAGAR
jgi:carboxyl-terminal processing protease